MGTVGHGGRIRRSHRHVSLAWVFLVRGHKGFGREQEGGGEKVSTTLVSIGTMGSPEFFNVGCSKPYFSVKKYVGGMMLVCY